MFKKERMLVIIGTAYGGMEDFNHVVRDITNHHEKLSCIPRVPQLLV